MSRQDPLTWSTAPTPEKAFGGSSYDPKRDYVRLSGQLARVFDVMKDGQWRYLSEIHEDIWQAGYRGDTQAAISARLRDLRKDRFGGHTVERRHVANGLFAYRLLLRSHPLREVG